MLIKSEPVKILVEIKNGILGLKFYNQDQGGYNEGLRGLAAITVHFHKSSL